ncbi:glycosyltransferase [Selenomonas flueggei]|uniref:Glycosyltransferase, group 2 family protein n=1 Tax=Selenomonas flueggei ATCC 43531 TaxID=638302 RepID=C4V4X3_9FIRM|nr:glycosyltransferase [Selenomonas flueggei]EEQ48021.1 glycosyltransferase, group 2 family protein [Selenomonas flueggei ATCC 43531]
MSTLSIVLTLTEAGEYLRETAESALAAASAANVAAEVIIPVPQGAEDAVRAELHDLPCRILPVAEEHPAAWNNRGAETAAGDLLLFLQEGVIFTAESLGTMERVFFFDERVAAVGPYSGHTTFSWQYINAESIAAEGADPEAWVREHHKETTVSAFLEGFALLVRRAAFFRHGKFDEAFEGGSGADIDLSFRLRCAGYTLLRVPAYAAHRAAGKCELWDLTLTAMRPLLLEQWGLDVGVPEMLWQRALDGIGEAWDPALVRATCRSAALHAPLVSIMIPTYNRPDYFRETLESARAQTYPNIEIIVCDNSTDERTAELMQAYGDDVRIRYVRNRAARTKAENFMPFERLAQGEYLQWCMDDDILLPDKITRMMDAFLREPGITLVTSLRGVVDGGGNYLGLWQGNVPVHGMYECYRGAAVGRATLMDRSNFLGEPSAVLFRRSDLTHHYWRAQARGYQTISDCAMWLELMERGDAVIFARPLSLYRRHEGQEGAQAEVIVRSRVEWRRLVEEYWHKRIFITQEQDYRIVLARMAEEQSIIAPLLPSVSAKLRKSYEQDVYPLPMMIMNRVEACTSIRLDAPLGALERRGDIFLSGAVREGDAALDFYDFADCRDTLIVLERGDVRPDAAVCAIMKKLGERHNIFLQEVDDHPSAIGDLAARNFFSFRAVSAIQTSTKYLVDQLRQFNPYIYLFENQLAELPPVRSYDENAPQTTIFFGALNRRADWEPLMPLINEAIHKHGERLRFMVVSDYGFYEALQTEEKQFISGIQSGYVFVSYDRYMAALRSSDIALLPLNDTEFNRAKSDLKFIEAAGNGAAVLAAPTVYAATVRDGETGLIYRSPKEFAQKLDLLIRRADLRRTLAENAYRYVAEHRLLAGHLDEYMNVYRELFDRREELERERLRRVAEFFPHL